MPLIIEALGRSAVSGPVRSAVERWLARPFTRDDARRCVVVYEPNRISFAQVYPFLHYASAFHARGIAVRLVARPLLATAAAGLQGVDVALGQTWFDAGPDEVAALMDRLRSLGPSPRLGYLDSFAHSDLRLARWLPDDLAVYFKKSLFRDHSAYLRAWRGDTNLTDFYGALYGIEAAPVDWATPPEILPKLRLAPNFLTAPALIGRFLRGPMPKPQRARAIDVHARLATRGSEWYRLMREDALSRITAMGRARILTGADAPWPRYMREMADARLCLSPFGYGEPCWRDVEGFLTGSVVIKPDMDHLETLPELYSPGETYLPVRWDFADLADVAAAALADPDRCDAIAQAAFMAARAYLADARFVDDMAFLFD